MRSFGKLLTVLALAALVFLVWPALVRDQGATASEPVEKPVTAITFLSACDMPASVTVAFSGENEITRRVAPCTLCIVQAEPVVSVTCDGNGWPLKERSWARSVYVACPP